MSESAILDLILKGGAIAVLVIVGVLILRGDLITKGSHQAIVAEIKAGNLAIVAELTSARDDWKGIGKALTTDVGELSDALKVRNEIDEELRQRGIIAPRAVST